jgi:hypothetical protein
LVGFFSYGHTNVVHTWSIWEITQVETIVAGYNINENVLAALKSILKKRPLVIPVEKYEVHHFSGQPNAGGVTLQNTFPLINCKAMCTLFPKRTSNLTCFENPNFDQYHLEMNNKHYPLSNTYTVGVEFFKINMEAAGLNNFWRCLES